MDRSVEAVDNYLNRGREGVHASDLTDSKMPKYRSRAASRMMIHGEYVERKWLDIWRKAGLLEYPLWVNRNNDYFKHGFSFTVGGVEVLLNPDAILSALGKKIVVEVKSTGAANFKQLVARGPLDKWVLRTKMYMLATGHTEGLIWVENRDTLEVLQFPQFVTEIEARAIREFAYWRVQEVLSDKEEEELQAPEADASLVEQPQGVVERGAVG